jgi:hypothetical protein
MDLPVQLSPGTNTLLFLPNNPIQASYSFSLQGMILVFC